MRLLDPASWPHKAKLVAAFATLYVVWGSTYLFIRIGLQGHLPPALFAGVRLMPAGAILLAFARARGARLRVPAREYRIIATVGILLLCGGMFGTFLAEQYIPSGLAALIVALLPLWIAAAEWALPGMERPTRTGVAGLVIGFSGLVLLMAPRLGDIRGTQRELLGAGILILGTWLWTAGSIYSKSHPVRADALVATGYEMLTAGGVLTVLGLATGEASRLPEVTPAALGALAYLIVIGSCLAFTAFVWALRNAPASKVMTYAFVNPVIAVLLGWVVLGEPVDWWLAAGMTVIVAGVAIATTAPSRPAVTDR